ncbi:MAG: hypothetical protein JXK07_01590 [Spirochaetes bacterium]|nr:hypothetical protein [Spirochaetota bacterium]MBN2772266.1 hypothetical protein [Spirochaetota bacterium]
MIKKIMYFLMACLLMTAFLSCSDDESEDKASVIDDYPLGDVNVTIAAEVMDVSMDVIDSAVDSAIDSAMMSGKRSATRATETQTINFTDSTGKIKVTGEVTYDSDDEEYGDFSYLLTIEFDDYEEGGVILDGQVDYEMYYTFDVVTGQNIEYTYSGDFKILYENHRYEIEWDFVMSCINYEYTITGTYTCNGESYGSEMLTGFFTEEESEDEDWR